MSSRTAAPNRTAPPQFLERLFAMRIAISMETALYIAIFAVAFALRFWDLGSRALHHDESIHAQWSWTLLQGQYEHSPIFHGPFYYHVQGFVFLIFGASDYTSRISAAIFGTALVALPLLLRRRLGPVGTLAAVAFIAFSPSLVYYSRFFREDIYMAFFTLLMVAAIWRYFEEGRDRWLVIFALAFTGSITTKEGTFVSVAVFLIAIDVYLAAHLAKATLQARDVDYPWRRLVLTGALAPYAWAIAALWPFLSSIRRNLDWPEQLPRPGDVLILLGTLILPLLTPALRPYFLEPLHIIDKDRLSWEKSLNGPISTNDRIALAGLFLVTISGAAFVGLQWRARLWTILFLSCGAIYLTLMTSFWTNWDGLVSGPWGSLDYWITQQDVARGNQPWFYYYMVVPAYEFLPLAIAVGGIWWSTVRGDAFSRFLVVWIAGMWLGLSVGAEKMPWLTIHLALPICVLAGWTVQRAWAAWRRDGLDLNAGMAVFAAAAVAAGALAAISFLPLDGQAATAVRVAIAFAAIAVVALAARPYGRRAAPSFLVAATVGALLLFSLRAMVFAVYERGDDPKDLLIYTQSSPDIPQLADQIDALAISSGKGFNLPIVVDTRDSYAWPWAWYLRDYKAVSYVDLTNGLPVGEFDVVLVNQANASRVTDDLVATGRFGPARKYPHRWWFDESVYRTPLEQQTELGYGALGPWDSAGGFPIPRTETWKRIFQGTFGGKWLDNWGSYLRDHDPHRPNGSTDAFAYFPANFDLEKGVLQVRPVDPPKPGIDAGGRAVFGTAGGAPGQFIHPVDIEIDGAGNLYVIDSQTRKLQKFGPDGTFIASVDIRIDPQNSNEAAQPWGLALHPDGRIVVADTFGWRIRMFDAQLRPLATGFGQPPDTSKQPGPFDLYGPRDIAIDVIGNLWITDTGNARINVYGQGGEYIRSIGTRGSGRGQFAEPVGLAFGNDGRLYVADMYNRRVQILDGNGEYVGEFAVDGWGGQEINDKPYLQPLSDGRIAVSLPGRNEVRLYEPSGVLSATIKPTDEPLESPYGIVETGDGKLWIVEGGNSRVRQFTLP